MSEQQIDELKQCHLIELEAARNHLTQTELALAGEVCDLLFTLLHSVPVLLHNTVHSMVCALK